MKLIAAILVFISTPAFATWQGKLDLSPTVSPLIIRELHDGQWLYGITKENIWHLDYSSANTNSIWNGQRFHSGVFQAWNAESGNASFGLVAGFDIPVSVSQILGKAVNYLGLPSTAKFLQYTSSAVSLDFLGGYRPVHTSDVNGNWVYGPAARLNISFGATDLKKGL